MGGTSSVLNDHRIVNINPTNDPLDTHFTSNRVISHKYTIWNFIPKNFFEQFRRVANCYFLLTTIIAISIESPISPVTSALPLSFVILVTACKQGYEDYLRYKTDQRDNRRPVNVIRNKCTQDIYCEQIVVGDFVKVSRDEDVPCDLVLLYSETPGCCYVTTSNLDGETNLKSLQVPKVVSKMPLSHIVGMEATITCQHPMANLYTFYGKLEINNGREVLNGHLTIDNLLLRGSRLKDTEYVVGCAVYTGQDTKLSLNSKIVSNKFSIAEKSINKYLIIYVGILLIEVLASTLLKLYVESYEKWDSYLGPLPAIKFSTLITDIMSFLILFNYIVPISLYVTVELQKFLGSFFFGWDLDMYDADSDQPALANSSDLNEELGQVEYLFTDKTGTLTENLMVFRRCSINGNVYMEKDCDGNLYLLPSSGNEEEAVKLTSWEENIWHFMISISLCHVVQIAPPSQRPEIVAKRTLFRESFRLKKITRVNSTLMMHPDLPQYQAASADEKALVEASARCGVIFQKDTNEEMHIQINKNALVFQKLEILEFTSERKRMSVIVKDSANDIWLYCKGADSAVLPLIVEGKMQEASLHVSDFSMRGLRTLVIAYKKMDTSEYNRLSQNIEQARQIIGTERAAHMTCAYNLMENGLILLGVTAVEDRLQDNVQETLECLRVAGIKIWVLTGDKAETAENIAFLCGHFKKGTEVLRLMEETSGQSCLLILTNFDRKIKLEPHKQYGLIIDGTSMAAILRNCPGLFKSVGMACEAVVCCRLTPLQKSEIVHLIKTARSRPHTAAIGDGGNDVSMIQEAHVGIGILGKEGRQASISADFAFTKFMYLKKALLVHGHWYYLRITILMQYFFYKNLVFITPQVLFGIHSGFSTQELYDGVFLMCFNLLFTSLPILLYGLLEQDHNAKKLMRHPYLYKLNKNNYLMSRKQFMVWMLLGLWHTGITYFMIYCISYINPTYLYDNTPVDHWAYSTCIFHIVTLLANLQILLRSSYWTFPLVLSVLLSELVFFLSAFCYSVINVKYDGDMFGVFERLLMSPSFWLITIIIVVVCLIPDFLLLTNETCRPMKILRRIEEPIQIFNCTDDDSERRSSQMGHRMFPWRGSLSLHKAE
ncbi:probable phospholipid-transporting ATPase IF isoform X3 [Nylanderia fulva]|uniref:probable phospholipid-transporting ATPase IF isoform X2 n=1 Tax=Nylanderia fulva TaxID=613905 RepID=UPI0010FACEDA|nr:probable phospholipid-transporting ATPase IF isoform X2 [Nylanderia fulva]XP_029155220.1 probable phospholipid-transporting ATPase IF isoform X3 [Nylanderia fulva]XP_029155221.1 probable phospholipid-transporting ATPase IF isoform X2 [Nylanderia fulva]XP_029155222.1 probable phospholipid-transporting ATPase IF isoform X3 [Nylanderia fulva]